jgi:DDE superfamily endonuclease
MKALGREHEGCHICTSENEWTDNVLGSENLKWRFELQSAAIQKGEYRILIVNGHDSHVTTEAIRSCTKHNIVSSAFHHIRRIGFRPWMSALWPFFGGGRS